MHLLAQSEIRRIDETEIETLACHLRIPTSVGIQERREARNVRRPGRWHHGQARESKNYLACRSPAMAGQGATRESRASIFGAASSRKPVRCYVGRRGCGKTLAAQS